MEPAEDDRLLAKHGPPTEQATQEDCLDGLRPTGVHLVGREEGEIGKRSVGEAFAETGDPCLCDSRRPGVDGKPDLRAARLEVVVQDLCAAYVCDTHPVCLEG